jgi:hypothetical protein
MGIARHRIGIGESVGWILAGQGTRRLPVRSKTVCTPTWQCQEESTTNTKRFNISTCLRRTGEDLTLPTVPKPWERIDGTGFVWYDTGQEHIITESTFRNCGYRGNFNQYDSSPTRGCDDSDRNGCHDQSKTFGFLTHSDQFTPELMQGTRAITFQNCGRRFSLFNWNNADTVSGRAQNWLDVDGSASGRGVPTFMVSGSSSAAKWWIVDDNGRFRQVLCLLCFSDHC